MNATPSVDAGESSHARHSTPPIETPESFTLRHRHRPWVAHQKLVAISFVGDAAVVLMALMLAYVHPVPNRDA